MRKPLVSVDDAQERAKRKLPKSVYDFIVGGSEEALTLQHNRDAFREITFRPRNGVSFPSRRLETTVLGSKLSMPVAIAPAGFIRLAHWDAELAAARAANALGTAVGVSTMVSRNIEEIRAATSGPIWYQIYFSGERQAVEVAIDRAKRAGCTALLITMDSPRKGYREPSLRGRGMPMKIDLPTMIKFAPEMITRPRWVMNHLRRGLQMQVPNVRLSMDGPPLSLMEADLDAVQKPATWADFQWIKERFGGPVAAKGILTAEDARRAVDAGADAVIVSNHGGYMLDSAPGTMRVLPEVVDAVGGKTEILLDSGVRRGVDVVKALALGAKAVLIGRAYVWSLAADGEAGVRDILGVFRDGIDRTLALIGCEGVDALDRSYLNLPDDRQGYRRY